ncbi:MAG: hypothetical protein EOP45_15100 [Sphingobacteriaceae bacterium]|nr:MAG: hypothetical protein EOP45_15100 [Sphingobacteriaceae bacterium]
MSYYETFEKYMREFARKYGEKDVVISGVDKMAERYAEENDIELKVHEAEWAKYGKRAGPLRNQLIVDDSNYLIAFPSDDSVGTYSSIHFGNQKGIKVVVHYV